MTIFIYILLSIISILLLLWQISNFISVFSGSLYVKSKRDVIKKALNMAQIGKSAVFYELGSGNGDVLIESSRYCKKVVGYEISPYYYLLSILRTLRYSNISVRYKNILDVDLRSADVIYCYLLPDLLKKIDFSKIKSSVRIISIGFPIPKLKLISQTRYHNHQIFIYSK